ncbi:hypothetical protein H2248_011293 [Termitomyces sp. 'cryptogamus']|nr:hypothetical protein H2248_011293 [Termitomyces sp. 'cryptogamus']
MQEPIHEDHPVPPVVTVSPCSSIPDTTEPATIYPSGTPSFGGVPHKLRPPLHLHTRQITLTFSARYQSPSQPTTMHDVPQQYPILLRRPHKLYFSPHPPRRRPNHN